MRFNFKACSACTEGELTSLMLVESLSLGLLFGLHASLDSSLKLKKHRTNPETPCLKYYKLRSILRNLGVNMAEVGHPKG